MKIKKFLILLTTITLSLFLSTSSRAANLISNWNFEQGNTGFYTDYDYKTPDNNKVLQPEGTYAIVDDPALVHTDATSLGDHTTGNGLMMVVNGSPTANQVVWGQNIAVAANQQYTFSAWINNWVSRSPSVLDFRVNDQSIGTFEVTSELENAWNNHEWIYFESNWSSANNEIANLSIVDLNTIRSGNDFIIDDLSFDTAPVPEPSSVILGLMGLAGYFGVRRRRN